jgi:alkanesulfonate monooxygenase SsuD/methylene tetrahydromethanopterin reductase-like flavin-dependent oxidoreductase (luciferase family)
MQRNFSKKGVSPGLRSAPPAYRRRWTPMVSAAPPRVYRNCRKFGLRGACGQRSPCFLPPVARWADRPVLGARRRLGMHLHAAGKDPSRFPNAIATMFLHVTEVRAAADYVVQEILEPTLRRPEAELRERLLVGPIEKCAQILAAFRSAGARRVLIWPIQDELSQLETFRERVVPLACRFPG